MSGPDPRPASTRKRPRTKADREASERFKRAVLALDRGCVAHPDGKGCDGPPLRAHHCTSQQTLRNAGRHDLLWSAANGMALCESAHRRHHNRVEPIRLSLVPARCLAFAREHGFADVVSRYYAAG